MAGCNVCSPHLYFGSQSFGTVLQLTGVRASRRVTWRRWGAVGMGIGRLAAAAVTGLAVATAAGGGVALAASSDLGISARLGAPYSAAAVVAHADRPARLAASAVAVPDAPMVASVVAEGLGLLVSWDPDPASEQVSSYTVTVVPAAGGVTPPAGCSGPFTLSVSGSNSACGWVGCAPEWLTRRRRRLRTRRGLAPLQRRPAR